MFGATQLWLVRLAEIFEEQRGEFFATFGDGVTAKQIAPEYDLVKFPEEKSALPRTEADGFLRWYLPIHHSWPCKPLEIEGFVEKAAQALWKKFGESPIQALLCGSMHPSDWDGEYRSLASNLRGRVLQLFPKEVGEVGAEEQHSNRPTLFVMLGKQGMYAGVATPQQVNGFYAGGTKFMKQTGPETISRAGAKVAEALHYLRLHRAPMREGAHWLELGAAPGGMTQELLQRGFFVHAVDRATLDPRLNRAPNLKFSRVDVAEFIPPKGRRYEAILSDMNGAAEQSFDLVTRLCPLLCQGGLLIFTLKLTGATSLAEMDALREDILRRADDAELDLLAQTHLTYNRHELTLFFTKK